MYVRNQGKGILWQSYRVLNEVADKSISLCYIKGRLCIHLAFWTMAHYIYNTVYSN